MHLYKSPQLIETLNHQSFANAVNGARYFDYDISMMNKQFDDIWTIVYGKRPEEMQGNICE